MKLQALVRGYLVRKQATATLHSMQALIRAQATVRSQRTRRFINDEAINNNRLEIRARKSTVNIQFLFSYSSFVNITVSAEIKPQKSNVL